MSKESEFLSKIKIHKGVVFKITKMYADSYEDSQDLYNEIIFQAWKSFSNFRGDSKFSTWLYRVALNTAITFIRKIKKSPLVLTDDYKFSNLSYEMEEDLHMQKLDMMYSSIKELSPIDKMLIFYFLEGYSGEDMAHELGLSEGNTRVKLNRAKNKLKDIINSKKSQL